MILNQSLKKERLDGLPQVPVHKLDQCFSNSGRELVPLSSFDRG